MSHKRKHRNKPDEEHSHIVIGLEHYDAGPEARVNHNAYAPQYAWDLDDDDPVYEFTNQIVIIGKATYPPERQGHYYELTIYGTESRSHRLNAKLKDIQTRDKYGSPQYRKYRGKQVPIYQPPNGLGLVHQVRGERRWTGWLFVPPRFVNDLLVLLGLQRNLFISLHEHKVDRSRWVQGLTLQTSDPSEE